MPEISFKIGTVFPADDPIARFITVVAMISNDWLRLFSESASLNGRDPETVARRTMSCRLQAALHYQAAEFLRNARSDSRKVEEFISGLPPEAREQFEQVVGGIDPESPYFQGRWLKADRHRMFQYSELNRRKPLGKALTNAADTEGRITYGDALDSVRFGFADDVAAQWLSDPIEDDDRLVKLQEAVVALAQFAQLSMSAYLDAQGVERPRQ
jgi:hypothetical protein